MSDANINSLHFFFVSLGAVLGVWVRFVVVEALNQNIKRTAWRTSIVNIIASFGLGLFISIEPSISQNNFFESLSLFLVIGFLGSMSTFSSFVLDLMKEILDNRYQNSFFLFLFSITGGLLAIFLGYYLGGIYLLID